MSRSSLQEVTQAIQAHMRALLFGSFPELFQSERNILISPSDDEDSDFRRIEEVQGVTGKVTLPAAVLSFEAPYLDEAFRQWSGREMFGIDVTPSTAKGNIGLPVNLRYVMKVYCNSVEHSMNIFEVLLLAMMDVRKIVYRSSIIEQEMPIQFEFALPQFQRISSWADRYQGKGHIYSLRMSFTARTSIMFLPNEIIKKILVTKSNVYNIGVDEDILLSTQVRHHDSVNDVTTEQSGDNS
jgi:hypothetical protein